MKLMNLGLTAPGFEMATTDVTDVPDTAGDTFLRDTLGATETPRHAAERRVGGVMPVRRPWHLAAAARLVDPRDEITQETPFEAEAVAAPVAAAIPTAPVIGTTDLQLDVRATIIKRYGKAILTYFCRTTTGMYFKPMKQEPNLGKVRVDIETGQLVTSSRPAKGPTVEVRLLVDSFHNRVILHPAQKLLFSNLVDELDESHHSFQSSFVLDGTSMKGRSVYEDVLLYRSILALDGMAILGHPADIVDPALAEANPEKLANVNKATLKILVPDASAITADWSDASTATGMAGAKNVRLYFAPDGSICRADARTASLEISAPYSEGFDGSPHYVDVAMTDNTILTYGKLSHLTPKQVAAFLTLYYDPEMANQRDIVEKEFPGLGQRVMTKALH